MPRKPKDPSERKAAEPGPKQVTVDLGLRCLELLTQGVDRSVLAERLHVTRKRVDYALKVVRKMGMTAPEPDPAPAPAEGKPRRKHRAVHHRPLTPPAGWAWQDRAACKGQPIELFFDPERREPESVKEARQKRAKGFCDTCPVQTECLDYAMSRPEQYGTWGKLDEKTRADERRRRMRAASEARRQGTAA